MTLDINPEDVIKKCYLFHKLSSEGRAQLAEVSEIRSYTKGSTIFRQEDQAPGIFVVVSGAVRLYKLAPNGKEHVLHLAEPGDTFAEVAVIGDFPCPANAEAIEACTCLLIPAAPFRKTLQDSHETCLQMMFGMAFWVRNLVGMMEGIVLRDASGRVARYLVEESKSPQPAIRLPGRKRDIASHLNLTSESFSRTLRYFREKNLIEEATDGELLILNPEGLRAVADGYFPKL